jgi:hypothetical protein
MENSIIDNWFFENEPPYGISIGDSVLDFQERINSEKITLMGETSNGYYYLTNGFRFGFSGNIIDEIGIDFSQSKTEILLHHNDNEINLSQSKIHEVLNFLNDCFIKWIPVENRDLQILIIKILEKEIFLLFDIYEGTLDKISKSNIQ